MERAEEAWRRSSPAWTARIEQWEKWKAKAKDRQRQEIRAKRNAGNKDEGPEPSTDTHSWQKFFDPNAPSEGFTFADVYAYSKADLDEDLRQLGWRAPGILNRLPWAFDALYRGIAVHHAGMNKHYRTLIERYEHIPLEDVLVADDLVASFALDTYES